MWVVGLARSMPQGVAHDGVTYDAAKKLAGLKIELLI